MSLTTTWILSIIFTIIFEMYPCSLSKFYFEDLSDFLVKSSMMPSQNLWIYFFLSYIIFWFLHSQNCSGIYVINNYNPYTDTSILLELRLDQGMFIRMHPKREYLILNGRLNLLIMSFFNLTLCTTTSPLQIPIFKFYELKS